jgi:hypothetical protein
MAVSELRSPHDSVAHGSGLLEGSLLVHVRRACASPEPMDRGGCDQAVSKEALRLAAVSLTSYVGE